jgi:thymidylate synthase
MAINITSSNFNRAWNLLINEILKNGEQSIIGDPDNPHPVKGSSGMITLKNNAIKQIESFEIDKNYPFKSIRQYADQFTYEWQKENGTGGFDYTYFNRLTDYNIKDYNIFDQLDDLRYGLQSQIYHNISSNRNHAITWIPEIDYDSPNPPCLQSINIRYINNNKVDIFLYWRSRDAYTAWQSNIIAITEMLNKYVIKPNHCSIRSLTDFCNHYHIYKSDFAAAAKIRSINPQINYR